MQKFLFVFKLWLVVWGMVTGLSLAIRWTGQDIPLVGQTAIISGIMVPIMVFIVIPLFKPNPEQTAKNEAEYMQPIGQPVEAEE